MVVVVGGRVRKERDFLFELLEWVKVGWVCEEVWLLWRTDWISPQ